MRTGQGPICNTVTGAIWPLSSYTCVIPTLRPIRPSGMAHHLLARDTDTHGPVGGPGRRRSSPKKLLWQPGTDRPGERAVGLALANFRGAVKMPLVGGWSSA